MRRLCYWISLFFIILSLTSCYQTHAPAPVVDAWYQAKAKNSIYRVQQGDTIYSIAWAFGLDYRALAQVNHLQLPYTISPGQTLKMVNTPAFHSRPMEARVAMWHWPARGRLVERFTSGMTGSQGIGISGKIGQPIFASASGEIVYSGDGVRGYGNLIIVKNNSNYLSAYAFNEQNFVRVGEFVKANQVIAKMGKNDAGRALLYFEIRYNGKPVNPLRFLH
ncbi:MAG: hypothetical protein ACD_44C00211G0003 [uncultured bacterium]|nr:MAG: hypothetical protein ACD_44C00211G0003 [uncultured bacterium]